MFGRNKTEEVPAPRPCPNCTEYGRDGYISVLPQWEQDAFNTPGMLWWECSYCGYRYNDEELAALEG